MAVPAGYRFPIEFDAVFPEGAYATGVEPVYEYNDKAGSVKRQDKDQVTGLLVWAVSVTDPSAKGRQVALTVKVAAAVQPVPPEAIPGTPFRPVVFEGLTATPYVDDRTKRLTYSLRATAMRAPARGAKAAQAGGASGEKAVA